MLFVKLVLSPTRLLVFYSSHWSAMSKRLMKQQTLNSWIKKSRLEEDIQLVEQIDKKMRDLPRGEEKSVRFLQERRLLLLSRMCKNGHGMKLYFDSSITWNLQLEGMPPENKDEGR
uniref:Uncharacterized protein n=1 Tax=Ditylenchus dipsaci TaxID=166011 RepID=A0A915E1M3_9BILA